MSTRNSYLIREYAKFAAFVAFGILVWASTCRAGTYNFYFNGTEQGDGSTAVPTVVVGEGPKREPAAAVESGPANEAPAAAAEVKSTPSESAAAAEPAPSGSTASSPGFGSRVGGFFAGVGSGIGSFFSRVGSSFSFSDEEERPSLRLGLGMVVGPFREVSYAVSYTGYSSATPPSWEDTHYRPTTAQTSMNAYFKLNRRLGFASWLAFNPAQFWIPVAVNGEACWTLATLEFSKLPIVDVAAVLGLAVWGGDFAGGAGVRVGALLGKNYALHATTRLGVPRGSYSPFNFDFGLSYRI